MTRALARRVVGVAVIVAVIAGGAADAVPSNQRAEFCGPRVARDYLQPLSKMAPIPHVSRSGRLPFAPRGIALEPRGDLLQVGGGAIGFSIRNNTSEGAGKLKWLVSVQLVKVNIRGLPIAHLGSKRRRLEALRGGESEGVFVKVGGKPAYYRTDISFRRTGSGEVLGRFSNYVRVVGPKFDARVLLLNPAARQGGVLVTRLANFGTETISSLSHDWRFTLQYFDGMQWVTAPGNPPPAKHKLITSKLSAGRMDQCMLVRIPENEVPGLYRVSMVVDRSLAKNANRTVQVTAQFEVSE